jgi:hypothetical protein
MKGVYIWCAVILVILVIAAFFIFHNKGDVSNSPGLSQYFPDSSPINSSDTIGWTAFSSMNICHNQSKLSSSGNRDVVGDVFCTDASPNAQITIRNNLNQMIRFDIFSLGSDKFDFLDANTQKQFQLTNHDSKIYIQIMDKDLNELTASEYSSVSWKLA